MMRTNKIRPLTATFTAIAMAAGLLAAAAMGRVAIASDSDDDRSRQEALLEYSRSQDILTFEEILQIIRAEIEGEIIEIEFEIEDNVPFYEIKFINHAGRVLEMYMDAKTGAFLEEEPD